MELIDLSMTIQPMWRWPEPLEVVKDFDRGDPYRVTAIKLGMHAFTHVDTPLHIEAGRDNMDQLKLENLCGDAAVVDLTPIEPNQEITAELLKDRAGHVRDGDIVLLKTAWDTQRDCTCREFWLDAPYVAEDAAAWLAGLSIKAVGFDFPQDYVIREIPDRHPPVVEMPTHNLILRKGIHLIEYLCGLDQLAVDRVELFALPLKVAGAEGACARVVAKI